MLLNIIRRKSTRTLALSIFSWDNSLEIKLQEIVKKLVLRIGGRYKIVRNVTQIKGGRKRDRSRRLNTRFWKR